MIMSGNLLAGSRDRYPLHSMAESGQQTKPIGISTREPNGPGRLRPRHIRLIRMEPTARPVQPSTHHRRSGDPFARRVQ